ncbi:hypothetical protein CEXT_196871 [Caerostris extrusa]|uniref:Ycf15 n=1 Tax=Caerostris extrusa TaxID=172846 RepID=A0AAV4Y7H0_CAEEX|nr:hypothetical protein CEXT_196871 [Caerostris extrusa]
MSDRRAETFFSHANPQKGKNRPDKEPPIRNHLPICHGMTNHNELIRLSRRSSLCSKRPIILHKEDVLQESCFASALPSVIRIVRVRFSPRIHSSSYLLAT